MDREQEEMQFLGLFGIYAESIKVIFAWRKIFSRITLALILPLSFIYLLHMELSGLFFRKIIHNEIELEYTKQGTAKYEKLSDLVSDERAYRFLFNVAYFILAIILNLLSTSAVVYTIACIYTARELTFKKVMSVVPKVWRRLMVTFLCMVLVMFLYYAAVFFIVFILILSLGFSNTALAVVFLFTIASLAGSLYLTVIWHLASVVSVLEEAYGFQAMVKSKNLIKGKLWVVIIIFFMLSVPSVLVQFAFRTLVVFSSSNMAIRFAYAVICFLLLSKLILFGLVIQTVIYFVCKSHHHENIDKSALSDHLEVYLLGEYVPLKSKDVQLEQYQV